MLHPASPLLHLSNLFSGRVESLPYMPVDLVRIVTEYAVTPVAAAGPRPVAGVVAMTSRGENVFQFRLETFESERMFRVWACELFAKMREPSDVDRDSASDRDSDASADSDVLASAVELAQLDTTLPRIVEILRERHHDLAEDGIYTRYVVDVEIVYGARWAHQTPELGSKQQNPRQG